MTELQSTESRASVRHQAQRVRRWPELLVGLAILVWGVYQSFWNIAAANLNADEPTYLQAGWNYLHGDFSSNLEHPPTAKFLIGLAQVAFGEGALAPRLLVGIIGLLGAVIIYFWLRLEVGWIGAAAAAGFWIVLPHGVEGDVRLDRFAVLEPFMVFFAIAAFAAAWMWFRTRSWWWLVLSAIAMALSVTSKVSTVVLLPAILLLPLLEKRWRDTILGGIGYLAVFAAVFVVVYLPLGLVSSVRYMLEYQWAHAETGHSVVVAGVVTSTPPWWANLLFSVEGMGIAASIVLGVGAVAAFFGQRIRLPLFLGSAVVLLWIFYLGISTVALKHYYYAWVWLFCALAGIGIAALIGRPTDAPGGVRARSRPALLATRAVAAALIALAVVSGFGASAAVAAIRPSGVALVAPALAERGVTDGRIFAAGLAPWEYIPYFEERHTTDPADPDITVYAVKQSPRFPVDPSVKALLADHASEFDVVVLDDVTLYIHRSAESAG
ncbi:glycosyltransferase family 39 protein [Herbiconiux sp. P17]|uniref:glycosyltransferase family 39 protein n=1 Tax=Herbiconiux wuyangfengii TaxID=3342794 RepID=UPI0035BA56C4